MMPTNFYSVLRQPDQLLAPFPVKLIANACQKKNKPLVTEITLRVATLMASLFGILDFAVQMGTAGTKLLIGAIQLPLRHFWGGVAAKVAVAEAGGHLFNALKSIFAVATVSLPALLSPAFAVASYHWLKLSDAPQESLFAQMAQRVTAAIEQAAKRKGAILATVATAYYFFGMGGPATSIFFSPLTLLVGGITTLMTSALGCYCYRSMRPPATIRNVPRPNQTNSVAVPQRWQQRLNLQLLAELLAPLYLELVELPNRNALQIVPHLPENGRPQDFGGVVLEMLLAAMAAWGPQQGALIIQNGVDRLVANSKEQGVALLLGAAILQLYESALGCAEVPMQVIEICRCLAFAFANHLVPEQRGEFERRFAEIQFRNGVSMLGSPIQIDHDGRPVNGVLEAVDEEAARVRTQEGAVVHVPLARGSIPLSQLLQRPVRVFGSPTRLGMANPLTKFRPTRARVVQPPAEPRLDDEQLASLVLGHLATSAASLRQGHYCEADTYIQNACRAHANMTAGYRKTQTGLAIDEVNRAYQTALVDPFQPVKTAFRRANTLLELNAAMTQWQALKQEADNPSPLVQQEIAECDQLCHSKTNLLCESFTKGEIEIFKRFGKMESWEIIGQQRNRVYNREAAEDFQFIVNARIKTVLSCRCDLMEGNLAVDAQFQRWWARMPEYRQTVLCSNGEFAQVFGDYQRTVTFARGRQSAPEPIWTQSQRETLAQIDAVANPLNLSNVLDSLQIGHDPRFWREVDKRVRLKLQTHCSLVDDAELVGQYSNLMKVLFTRYNKMRQEFLTH
jgi:hypothetical protein